MFKFAFLTHGLFLLMPFTYFVIGVSLYKLLAQGLWKGDFMCFGLLTWLCCGIFSHWGTNLYHKFFYIEMFVLWVCVILTKFSSLCTDFINNNKKIFNNFIAFTLIFKTFVLALLWYTLCDILILSWSQMFRYPKRNNKFLHWFDISSYIIC